MKREDFKEKMSAYLEGELSEQERREFRDFLARDKKAQAEFERYAKSWEMLGRWEDAEPDPGYVSRFWTRVAQERPWHEQIWTAVRAALTDRALVPVYVTMCAVIIVGVFTLRTNVQTNQNREFLAQFNTDEIEFIRDMDLAENLEIIENLDILQDLDIIENLDALEAQSA